LGFITQRTVAFWRNSITLFTHAQSVTRDNYIAHNNLGEALAQDGQNEQLSSSSQSGCGKSAYDQAHQNLGMGWSNTQIG